MQEMAIFVAVLATSLLSGVLGMGGGVILMGVFVWLLPVPEAMMLHGITQLVANGSRVFLGRRDALWPLMPAYIAGTLGGLAIFTFIRFVPPPEMVYLLIGALPFVALRLPATGALDIRIRSHTAAAGFAVNVVQLLAGASGPILDVFFLKSDLTRQAVVSTKAMTQTFAHLVKILYFGGLVRGAAGFSSLSTLVLVLAVAAAVLGTALGRRVLSGLTDARFHVLSRRLVLVVGALFLARGVWMLSR